MSHFASSSSVMASGSTNQFFRLTLFSSIPAKPMVQAKLKCGGFFISARRGGLGKAHQLFGEQLPKLLDELNEVLAA